MQQIERYGVIALVFFLITIVAVSFWGDSKSPGFWSRLTGRGKKDATPDQITPPPASTDVVLQPVAPLDQDPSRGLVANPATSGIQPIVGSETPASPSANLVGGGTSVPSGTQPPVAAPQPLAAPANEYVVQKGDSPALIARRMLGKESRWTEIQALNPGLTPKNLKIGQKLAMPADALAVVDKPAAPATTTKKSEPAPTKQKTERAPATEKRVASANTCKVQKGDTYKAIARRELGDSERWKEIADLNPGVPANKLSIGQTLRLPAGSRAMEHPVLVADAAPVADNKPRIR